MPIDWMCYRIVMAWPLPLPDCRENRVFAWCLARAGAYADPTPNVKLTGDGQLYRPASSAAALSDGLDGTLTTENNMGNTWEIQVWKRIDWRGGEYGYEEFWRGQNWMSAAWNFLKAKREGHGCVTLHWR